MAAVGTAFGYAYTCLAAWLLLRRRRVPAPGGRAWALGGAALSLGFLVLLCVPDMPAFMATPSWIALGVWVALGALFLLARAGEYRSLPAGELDRLILGRSP